MIAKMSKGRDGRSGGKGFGGATRYVLGERPAPDGERAQRNAERQPEIIGGNIGSRDAEGLTREFGAVRAQRPEVEKPVHHVSLSFDPKDRPLSDAEMARIAERYLERSGFDLEQNQYVIVRHHDKDYQHCHVVANRVRLDGALTKRPGWEYKHSREQCRELEKEFGLHPPRSRAEGRALDHAPTRGEDRMRLDRGLESEKEQLRQGIREAARGSPTMTEFLRRLDTQRIQVRPNMGRSGDPTGLSYRLDHVAIQGRKLGPAYSWKGVQKHLGVRYDERRDRTALEEAARATLGREPERSRPIRGEQAVRSHEIRSDPLAAASRLRSLVRDPGRALEREVVQRLLGAAARAPGGREVSAVLQGAKDIVNLVEKPGIGRAVEAALRAAGRLDSRAAVVAKAMRLARGLAEEIILGSERERRR